MSGLARQLSRRPPKCGNHRNTFGVLVASKGCICSTDWPDKPDDDNLQGIAVFLRRRLDAIPGTGHHAIVGNVVGKAIDKNFWNGKWFDESFVSHASPAETGCCFYSNSNLSTETGGTKADFQYPAFLRCASRRISRRGTREWRKLHNSVSILDDRSNA